VIVEQVPDVNHYTVILDDAGTSVIAAAVLAPATDRTG
jgi:hypothetical protein